MKYLGFKIEIDSEENGFGYSLYRGQELCDSCDGFNTKQAAIAEAKESAKAQKIDDDSWE